MQTNRGKNSVLKMKGHYDIVIILHCITVYYTLSNFIAVSATFKFVLASLGGKVTESLNHREGKDVLGIVLQPSVWFFNKRTRASIIITLKKFAFDYI